MEPYTSQDLEVLGPFETISPKIVFQSGQTRDLFMVFDTSGPGGGQDMSGEFFVLVFKYWDGESKIFFVGIPR